LAVEHGAIKIVATERASGQVWRIDLATFREHGGAYSDPRFGDQWYCAFAWWATDAPETEPATGEPVQAPLFTLAVKHGR
jgi:hypothetical protein